MPVKRLKIKCHGDTFKRALFEDPAPQIRQSAGTSQKSFVVALASSSKARKDMTDFEWMLHYEEFGRKLLLVLGKTVGLGVIAESRRITYGKVLRIDYEDQDTPNFLLHAGT